MGKSPSAIGKMVVLWDFMVLYRLLIGFCLFKWWFDSGYWGSRDPSWINGDDWRIDVIRGDWIDTHKVIYIYTTIYRNIMYKTKFTL